MSYRPHQTSVRIVNVGNPLISLSSGLEASEVDRYVVNPGQACAYMIGQLTILELRERARRALGGRVSLQAFHNAVLTAGTLPLDMLEREVDAYIRAALQSRPDSGNWPVARCYVRSYTGRLYTSEESSVPPFARRARALALSSWSSC